MNYILLVVSVASQIIKLINIPSNIVAIIGTKLNKMTNIINNIKKENIIKEIIYKIKGESKWLYY